MPMHSNDKILVVGSINTDMVVKSAHLPKPGETVLGGGFLMNPGGKGANQAVAAAKLGGKVSFIAKIGDDIFGQESILGLQKHEIDTSAILIDKEHPSGVAIIMVNDDGENCISVALGANGNLSVKDIDHLESFFENVDYVLIQLEIPLPTVEKVVQVAAENNKKVILNPAPAAELSPSLLSSVYLITPNESEATLLTGIDVVDESSAKRAAEVLIDFGVSEVIITLGSKGAYLHSEAYTGILPAPRVEVVDTTAAGDTFNGALAVALSKGQPLKSAVEFAIRAAAFSVTRMGAQSSAPTLSDLKYQQ